MINLSLQGFYSILIKKYFENLSHYLKWLWIYTSLLIPTTKLRHGALHLAQSRYQCTRSSSNIIYMLALPSSLLTTPNCVLNLLPWQWHLLITIIIMFCSSSSLLCFFQGLSSQLAISSRALSPALTAIIATSISLVCLLPGHLLLNYYPMSHM